MLKKPKNHKLVFSLATVAAIAVTAIILLAFSQPQPFFQEKPLKIEWNVAQAPSYTAQHASEVELTVYSIQATGYSPIVTQEMTFDYGAGLALVKEKRVAVLSSGMNFLSIPSVAAHIDPSSIQFKDSSDESARVLEQNYEYDLVSQEKLLEKYVGKEITVRMENKTVSGTLLSGELGKMGLVLQTNEGITQLMGYEEIVFPRLPEGLITTPTIEWLLEAQKAGEHSFELSYLTSGIAWNADYVAEVNADDSRIDLQGWVTLRNNAGTKFENARLKLVAGDVHLVGGTTYEPRYYVEKAIAGAEAPMPAAPMPAPAPQFKEQQFFEYHLYELDRPTTIRDNEVKQIALLAAGGIPVKKELVFQPSRESKVQVKLAFNNSKPALGIALPKGRVRVFKTDDAGRKQFLGEDAIRHSPEGEEIRLFVGNAFDVTAEKTEKEYHQIGRCASQRSFEVKIKNKKSEAIVVKAIEDQLWGEWEVVKENLAHDKKDAHSVQWSVSVPAKSEFVLEYTIQQEWC